jgi:hypothetical protein
MAVPEKGQKINGERIVHRKTKKAAAKMQRPQLFPFRKQLNI